MLTEDTVAAMMSGLMLDLAVLKLESAGTKGYECQYTQTCGSVFWNGLTSMLQKQSHNAGFKLWVNLTEKP